MSNLTNLSAAEKDRILAALLQNHPQLVESVVQQVTANSHSPLQQPQPQQQQQALTGGSLFTLPRDDHGSDSSSSTDSEAPMDNSPEAATAAEAAAAESRKRPRKSPSRPAVTARKRTAATSARKKTTPIKKSGIKPAQEAAWQERYLQLIEYKKIHGTTEVPIRLPGGLGKWIHNQRQAYRAFQRGVTTDTGGAIITAERIQALDDVGMVWCTLKGPPLVSFERRLEQMRMYKIEHGHLYVPRSHVSGLSAWLNKQRTRQPTMRPERRQQLDAAGLIWAVTRSAKSKKCSVSSSGTAPSNNDNNDPGSTAQAPSGAGAAAIGMDRDSVVVPAAQTINHPPLMAPQQEQPQQPSPTVATTAHETTTMQYSDIKQLPSKQRWQAFYEQLVQYKQIHGTTNVPTKSSALGKWVANQRQAYRTEQSSDKPATGSTLTSHRIQQLNDIGFVWKTQEPRVSFETRLEQLRKFRQEHGHSRVPKHYDTTGLSWWLQTQRDCRRSMSRERFAQLDAAGMEWDTMSEERSNNRASTTLQSNDDNNGNATSTTPNVTAMQDSPMKGVPKKEVFEARCQQLIQYKQVHGTTCVPVRSKTFPFLGKWVANQRQAYRAYHSDEGTGTGSTLTAARIEELNALGFVWNTLGKPLVSLETRLEQMRTFRLEHGHLNVPANHPSDLNWWLQAQRKRQYIMSRERRTQLEKAGMEWD